MTMTEMIRGAIEYNYGVAEKLIDLVGNHELNWKPATGHNWMTTGQLLKHISNSCGEPIKGFVTGDWGFPAGVDPSQLPPEEMMPPAEKLPAVLNVAEAKQLLADDKKLALEMLSRCSEERLTTEMSAAPWDKMGMPLGQRMLEMVQHINQHKGQLFYYLKLQGKPVDTGHLWGM